MPQESLVDVIAVGAHPDDVEIGCGGTLARLVQLGYRVGIIDLTDGEPTPLSPGPETRLAEAETAARILGVAWRKVLDLPNRRLFDSFESRVQLAMEFRRQRPRVVFGLAGRTPMASPDHWQAAQITDAAVFYSRLSKWDEHFGGLPVHRIDRQLQYHLGFDPAPVNHFGASVVQDIGGTLALKMDAIQAYQTQFPPGKAQVLERARNLALAVGHSAGFQAGERFYLSSQPGTPDVVRFALSSQREN